MVLTQGTGVIADRIQWLLVGSLTRYGVGYILGVQEKAKKKKIVETQFITWRYYCNVVPLTALETKEQRQTVEKCGNSLESL